MFAFLSRVFDDRGGDGRRAGGIETLGLIGEQFGLSDPLWSGIGVLNDKFNQVGFLIIGVFIAGWIGSLLLYQYRGLDDIRVSRGRG
jgi:high-affinity nickel-transport protein